MERAELRCLLAARQRLRAIAQVLTRVTITLANELKHHRTSLVIYRSVPLINGHSAGLISCPSLGRSLFTRACALPPDTYSRTADPRPDHDLPQGLSGRPDDADLP